MKMQLTTPAATDEDFADLPLDLRNEVRAWMRAFTSVDSWKPVGRAVSQIAAIMGVSVATSRRKYDALRRSGGHWSALVDLRRAGARPDSERALTGNRELRSFVAALAERHQRNSKAAYRKLLQAWQAREPIPGCEGFPGWPEPPFSYRTFARIVQAETDRRRLNSIRVGTSSKSGSALAQVYTTRVGLYPGAVYQFDDVWHDNLVTLGRDPRPTRVLELGVLDLFSGCRFHWGAKPRMPKEGGGMEGLKEREMRFFVAGILANHGVSQRGTRFMIEHGTAALREDVVAILHDSGLPIEVDRQPIEGKQQALTGFWAGSEGGNFRAKAALESVHNLIHNDLGHLALQTGSPSSGLAGPVTTDRQASYIAKVIKDVVAKVPHRADLLRLPSLDFHSQFLPLLTDYYDLGLNSRTDHDLEGWDALGFTVTEYTTAPGSGHYLSPAELLRLPMESQRIIAAAAKADPHAWTRRRRLSPAEVWNLRRDFLTAPAPLICDILGKDLSREVKVKGSYITFADKDIAPEPLIYEARCTYLNGAQRELPAGEVYSAFANPFAPQTLFLLDARDRYLGTCPLVQRVTATDRTALIAAAGLKAQRNAEILEPLRVRHAEQVADAQALREHNRRVIADEPVTADELQQDRTDRALAMRQTRRANRMTDDDLEQTWDDISHRETVAHGCDDDASDDFEELT